MRIPNILPMLLLAISMPLAAQNTSCSISDLTAQVVDCVDDEFYVKINFNHANTSNEGFAVAGNNGVSYGNFSYDDLPVVIGPFAADGTTSYGFLVQDLGTPTCAADIGIGTVSCSTSGPCEIYDLVVETGPCNDDGTYVVKINFKVENATNDLFDLWGNNQYLGSYKLSDLPLKIDNFPAGNSLVGLVKVCINDNPNCCRVKEFTAPDCSQTNPCVISDVTVKTGDCQPGGVYKLLLDFKVSGANNDFFEVWAGNGQFLGYFPLSQLPLSLPFPWGGGAVDKIKICINDNPDCCKVVEFAAPPCFDPCRIGNLSVETGNCTSDTTFEIKVNFQLPANSPVDSFGLWASNGDFLGRFAVADLPVFLTDFPWGGGSIDGIRVCVSNSCCREKEFNVPDCLAPPCGIEDLKVGVGGCTSPKSYKLELNFSVNSTTPADAKFQVWADNGDSLGTFSVSQLPLGLNFPWNGDAVDALKVCLLDADGNEICCEIISFDAPDCVGVDCGIFNLEIKTGDCLTDNTYEVWINFQTPAVSPQKFGVWAGAGKFLGFFSVADLPVYIKNFPASGASTDKIIICFSNACCTTKEFNAPDCAGQPCGIDDLVVKTGDCTSDSTYQLLINFKLTGSSLSLNVPFRVYADNGDLIGTFNTSDLPLTINDFPWNGNAVDAVKICVGLTNNTICCKVKEFKAPDCLGDPCGIFNLKVETGDCNNDGTYEIWVNFQTTAAANTPFGLWAGNGQFLGVFSVADLPVHISNFPGSGQAVDAVKVCLVNTASTPPCCRTKEFKAPACSDPCGIAEIEVKVGDCSTDETYEVWIDLKVNAPSNTTLAAVYTNGDLYGVFPLADFPLYIPDFHWNGGQNDVVKVCLVTPLTVICCKTVEFAVPDCLNPHLCSIYDFVVDPGECTSDKTYKLFLNFKVDNPGAATHFGVWANGTFFGSYPLSDLPLTIPDFPWGGGQVDVVKVCIQNANDPATNPACCAVKEFHVPDCLLKYCDINDLKVETGDCNPDGTYEVWINFNVANPPALSTHFGVWANGQLLGFFPLTQLPLYIPNFPSNGGPNDVVKICLSNTGAVSCCAVKEFPVPDCLSNDPCKIYDVTVQTGDCHNDGTYTIKVNFKTVNPGNDFFELWAGNGNYLGYFPLNQLPLVFEHFPASGNDVDVLRICINDNPDCCKVIEFAAPDCSHPGCSIEQLTVQTGDCNADGTYQVWLDFEAVSVSATGQFGVWANGQFIGAFPLNELPLHIEHFPTNGGVNDVIKVCLIGNSPNLPPLCCETLEFPVPDCVTNDPCQINDLVVETGDCNPDGTYQAWVNFNVGSNTPAGLFFGVWANGEFLGSFPLANTNLPFHIPNFPTNPGPNDVVKVCLVTPNATVPLCCETLEFPVPDCSGGACKIWDLAVQTTPCLCGQFFAVLTFNHQNGGSGGFDIVGNGMNYGNFPYNQAQPIILGPLDGDGTTEWEFVVQDHLHPDCQDAVELGTVDCTQPFQSSGTGNVQQAGKLSLSPNPTSNWLAVTTQLNSGALVGQATVEIRQADGRLVRSVVVPDAAAFQLDVSELQAGLYRLSLQSASARLESTFAKQ
ncbi:MAG: hypothetical protein IPM36_02545 [Lewinellaceae bacterium]|nr:hypothetical protein [Lewinellaceae bacterium]